MSDRLARPTRREAGIGKALQRTDKELAQLPTLLLDPEPVLARQEAAARERGRFPRSLACRTYVACAERGLASVGGLACGSDVDPGARGEHELVAAEGASQRRLAVDTALLEQRSQLAHEHRERLLPGRRRRVAPEHLGEFVPWHRPALLREQVCEHQPALTSRERPLVQPRPVCLDRDAPR